MTEKLLTTGEVAEVVRARPETVRYWRSINTGPRWFRIGRRVLYSETDLEAWVREQREAGRDGVVA